MSANDAVDGAQLGGSRIRFSVHTGEQLPRYLIRDRDACYGDIFVRRVRSLGIRDHPTSAHSPWQNGYAERLIGSIRRECSTILL